MTPADHADTDRCPPGCPKCAAEYLDAKERAEAAADHATPKFVLWVIPDRGGGWTQRDTADTRDEAEAKRNRLYARLGDVSVRVLLPGEKPWGNHLDVADQRRSVT